MNAAWGPNSVPLALGEKDALVAHRDHGIPKLSSDPEKQQTQGCGVRGKGLAPQPGLRQNQAPGSQQGLQRAS